MQAVELREQVDTILYHLVRYLIRLAALVVAAMAGLLT
jgi:hypothetical protein